tara:strand:- start:2242 stop:2754 length:513 start_codon:yes stop_codon:yes gene_type:complete
MRISKAFWLWGQFSSKDTEYINGIKNEVKSLLKSPIFDAHVTLAGPFSLLDKSFFYKLKALKRNNNKIDLHLKSFNFETEFYKSFYISIKNSEELNSLRKDIYELNKFDIEKEYEPHISLAYGNHKSKDKKNMISNLAKLNFSIKMTRISLVDVNENINRWGVLDSFNLK